MEESGATPQALLALLLLLTLPSEFTFRKFVELLVFGERCHQFALVLLAEPGSGVATTRTGAATSDVTAYILLIQLEKSLQLKG